jgi:hypothetical protein
MVFPNPSISGTAIVKALDHDQATAHHRDSDDAQAALDEAELREEERADYYGDPATTEAPVSEPHRSWLYRLLHR